MKKILLCAALMLTALTACNASAEPADTVSSAVTETTAEPAADTTTSQTETTTVQTERTTASAAETTAPTTAAVTETSTNTTAQVYTHMIELQDTQFARQVPEQYRSGRYQLPESTLNAIQEGRDILGVLNFVRIDAESNTLYVGAYFGKHYGFGGEELSVRKGYSFYRVDGNTGAVTEIANDDDSPLRNMHMMIRLGGRLLVSSYHGFYLIDEEKGEIVTLDRDNEPLGGSTSVCGDKVYLSSLTSSAGGEPVCIYREYDPASNSIKEISREDYIASGLGCTFFEYAIQQASASRVTRIEREDGGQTYRIEW